MIIGTLRLEFRLHGVFSLKEKRKSANSLKQKLRNTFNVSVAETEAQDSHQTLVLGVVIGASAGLGAIVFYEALVAATHFFLGVLAGYQVPTPAGEGGHAASASSSGAWRSHQSGNIATCASGSCFGRRAMNSARLAGSRAAEENDQAWPSQ